MINRIWGLKATMTTNELTCLISFAWDPLSCSEQAEIENFKIEIYVYRTLHWLSKHKRVNASIVTCPFVFIYQDTERL